MFIHFIKFFRLLLLITSLSPILSGVDAEEIHHKHHPFKSINEYIQRMESPDRAEWQKPKKVVDYLAIRDGDVIADIGAGSGYFSVLLSKRVGDSGRIYAVDIENEMIEYIEKRAKKERLNNIKTILSKSDDPLLLESSIDLIFICDTYHHIEGRDNYLKILKKVLKKNGRLAIVDFHVVDTPVGPPLNIRISKDKIMGEILKAGFKLEADYYFLPYQYFLIFTN
ncbi:MAG: hypothetical protein A3I04_03890 [Nitrospinae bacterium RIFCSPLOWO2_02_FULL_39_110]|nr:MAG: hypothetical protein A2W53_07600 [Nitrospinae bacterium RIFCSPHIGHO2_02_39_11]OGW00205.1 MAG: hypothetical protein A3D97_00825 [Nitrospinae bacterium RIFCSPHIGHO2_12_FULL_39_42]OGW00384.1 MAG: hypothetical protein A3D20_04670 [Nitrospinae bacterium RIFCSPHIGHO2_02_FULL_39_82]OGW03724.1 MAG: hypothetical protein A2Z59_04770 [Nitrospinae bacterium RIFCSPLOWO2_02_39_17]OGW04095.1 MAG: hypothetical protein A3I04_03890 [Nitrospinae bacterium RIFCSPLOWO2_02_FULL_39_110]OGW08422.1 MAG: hypoth